MAFQDGLEFAIHRVPNSDCLIRRCEADAYRGGRMLSAELTRTGKPLAIWRKFYAGHRVVVAFACILQNVLGPQRAATTGKDHF